jgi:hypothetical protein
VVDHVGSPHGGEPRHLLWRERESGAAELGHKNASMTLDLYSHLYTEDLEDLAARLDARYRSAA